MDEILNHEVPVEKPEFISFEDLAKDVEITHENYGAIDKDFIKARDILTAKKKRAGII